jgi:hypothetical protein
MRLPHPVATFSFLGVLAMAACSPGRRAEPQPADASRLLVTADTAVLERSAAPADARSLDRLALELGGTSAASRVEANYRLTTPADTPFAFDLVSWRDGGAGAAAVPLRPQAEGAHAPAASCRRDGRSRPMPAGCRRTATASCGCRCRDASNATRSSP